MKWIHKKQGRHTGVKTFSWQEIRQLKAKAKVNMINKYLPHTKLPIFQGQEVYGNNSRW